jgi:tRNA threonylcarbamoyladenosine biosynthesis protein TsaB
MLLAIDTSTTRAGVALYDGRVLAELSWLAGRDHGRQLLPLIHDLLERLGRRPADLAAVAAARGPGSFTGLRVGLAVARGLGFALGVPLYGIGSLDVLAAGLPAYDGRIRAVLEAGRGRVATAAFEPSPDVPRQLDQIRGLSADELPALVREEAAHAPCAVVGDLTPELRGVLADLASELGSAASASGAARLTVATPAASVRRPAVLAELAWRRHASGHAPDPAEGEPIYLARG